MRIIKKISIILLALTLCVPSISMVAYAADGSITFTDPETKVGDMVDIKCAVRSDSGDIGEVELILDYDSESLRFDSGDGVTKDGDGTLTYTGTGNSSEVTFTMKFQALEEGSAQVSITSATVNSGYGSTMSMEEGSSTVTIGEGDPSKIKDEDEESEDEEGDGESDDAPAAAAGDMQVVVDGTTYTLTDKFADADIPAGYSRTTVSLEGEDRQMVENESGNICLGYLVDSGNVGDFFMYNEEDATFVPYEEIAISDMTSIIVLSDTSKVKLPSSYQEVSLTLNDKEFPVWQDKEHDGYYIIYAMNNSGETGYYQYDSNEGTYQRVEISAEEKTEKKDNSFLGKFKGFFDKHFSVMFVILCLLGIGLIALIAVLAVKLRNRNLELDDLYDEYGIDLEDEEPPVKAKEKEKKPKFGFLKREDDEEDDDFDEDGFGGLAISKINLDDDDFDDDDFDEDDFDEDDFDEDGFDEDDFEEREIKKAVERPAKKSSKKSVKKSSIRAGEDDIFSDKKLKKYDTKTVRQNLTIGEMDDGGDLDDLLEDLSGKKPGHQEKDDAFKVNFVDLD